MAQLVTVFFAMRGGGVLCRRESACMHIFARVRVHLWCEYLHVSLCDSVRMCRRGDVEDSGDKVDSLTPQGPQSSQFATAAPVRTPCAFMLYT